jgi:hypothetical protein
MMQTTHLLLNGMYAYNSDVLKLPEFNDLVKNQLKELLIDKYIPYHYMLLLPIVSLSVQLIIHHPLL